MNIGILIFAISVIISIISAMGDKSHKQRQNQKPPKKKAQSKPTSRQPQKGSFLDKVGDKLNEMNEEISGEHTKHKKVQHDKNTSQPVYKDRKLEREIKVETQDKARPTVQRSSRQLTQSQNSNNDTLQTQPSSRDVVNKQPSNQDLEHTLMDDLKRVRLDIDNEKEKQLAMIEQKAKEIISDKYLSPRAKQYRLKQLLNTKSIEQNMTHQALQFDNNPVVNGLIWQEIFNKPKQL